MSKEIWIKADHADDEYNRHILETAADNGIDSALTFCKTQKFVNVLLPSELRTIVVDSPDKVQETIGMLGSIDRIALVLKDWKIIPVENIIANTKGTKILVEVSTAEEARLYLNILEKGADGVIINTPDADSIERISYVLKNEDNCEFTTATVERVTNVGIGDRVCVDSLIMMTPKEGMLIGSQSSCLFLIQSESEDSRYIEPRPFRVNAGSVHSYILVTENKTRYLSELRSGDPLLITDSEGNTKRTSVGRCKMEKRPMLMVEAMCEGKMYSLILQNAETVRLIGPNGSFSVTSAKKGDKVFVKLSNRGKHCGTDVDETVREV